MAVLVPAHAWESDAPWAADLRAALAGHWDTLVVLYGNGVLSHFHPSAAAAAVFLSPRDEARPPLKIFRVPPRPDATAVEKDFERLLARGGGRLTYGYVVRGTPEPHEGLDFDRFDPDILDRRADLAGFGSVDTLMDRFLAPPVVNETEARKNWTCSAADPGAVRLLGGREIGRDGLIASPSEETRWAQVPADFQLAVGDLVIRRMNPTLSVVPHGFVVAEVTAGDLPAAATSVVTVLRPAKGLEPQQVRFITMFLRTPLARKLAGPGSINATARVLLSLPIPQPDEALSKALDDLAAAKQQFKDWETEAESVLESVFLEKTAALARSRVIKSGRALRLRVEAASLLDELGHTVRTRFPYPIAHRWRETEALMSAGDPQASYGAVLDTAEILLCYTAQLALALARAAGVDLGAVVSIKDKLATGRSGPGFGDWAAVLLEVATSKKLRQLPAEHPLNDIRTVLANKAVADARQRLSDRRNDQAHLRRVDPIDLPRALQEAFADLTALVEGARFLADWSLVHITDVRWDALAKTADIEFQELMGDHPVVPTRAMTSPDNDLETGSLYLRDPEHGLHLLRPFLIGQNCPTCRSWSTFHVDRVPKGGVVLKSLEHGHVFEDTQPGTLSALRHVGLL
ncbi:restriction endonuclease [Streptomyces sp. NPDC051366]|uniref:restriction endonuclease n=1 Tax=Streptomyces sp. NPDC051366 TaxID=3365652 RepID=UPI0037AA8E6E